MEYLGGVNLITSHFVIGCKECYIEDTKTHTNKILTLHNWLDYKDSDRGMKTYRVDRTQYISFPHIIELKDLAFILKDLISIYKKAFPYSEKSDFISHVLSHTIYELNEFISWNFTWLAYPPNEKNYQFYYHYDFSFKEFIDIAIPSNHTIENYKQYFKKVIQLINDLEFDENDKIQNNQQNDLLPKQIETDKIEVINSPDTTNEENDLILSTIEDWLYVLKENMSQGDYSVLVSALQEYFKKGSFPQINKVIWITGKINKKLFGWHLNQIYRDLASGKLPKEYLVFAKDNISIFEDVYYDESDYFNCNLYKYFTTKIK